MTPPVALQLQHAYRAVAAGDLDPLFALMADDVHWHVDAGPLAGDYVGKSAVRDFFGRMLTLYDAGTFTQETVDVIANDRHAVVLSEEGGRRGGDALAFSSVHVWRLARGRCVRFDVYPDHAYHAFWSVRAAARAA